MICSQAWLLCRCPHASKCHDQMTVRPFLILLLTLMSSMGTGQAIAFTLPEQHLMPECIAWSDKHRSFFFTSIYLKKIVRYDPDQDVYADFIHGEQDGFDSGIGLIVDERRDRLWAVCGRKSGETYIRGIYVWDIGTGALLHHYRMADTVASLFNDLTIDMRGDAYITDTYNGRIYRFSTGMKEPQLFLSGIPYPNGITRDQRRSLFIASHTEGIVKADLRTKALTYLEQASMSHTGKGLDGLKFYRGSLIGVFNASVQQSEQRVIRYFLNQPQTQIEKVEIMDAGHPRFAVPTTGVVVKDQYYLIANSCLDFLDQETFTLPDPGKVSHPVILRYPLKKK